MVQGVRLRVVGVCDSKSMVAAPDVLTSELDDELLLQLCKVKYSGGSLQETPDFGNVVLFVCSFALFVEMPQRFSYMWCTGVMDLVYVYVDV